MIVILTLFDVSCPPIYEGDLMVRISKQAERRSKYPHRRRPPAAKTGTKQDNLPLGYREHTNVILDAKIAQTTFIPKIS